MRKSNLTTKFAASAAILNRMMYQDDQRVFSRKPGDYCPGGLPYNII